MGRLVIYGAGGMGREAMRRARQMVVEGSYDSVAFASDDNNQVGAVISGLPVIAPRSFQAEDRCVLAASNATSRRLMASRCPGFASLTANTAVVYDGVDIGPGAIVTDYCVITADAATTIGAHFQINTHSTVGHDCSIGDFVTIGPKVSVNGNVVIEDDVYVGCGAHIRNGVPGRPLRIGRGSTIGMGAIVTKDVPPHVTVVGNPARPMHGAQLAVA